MAAGVPPFSNHLPVNIRFGQGVAVELGGVVRSRGADQVLLIADAGLEEANAAVGECVAALLDAGVRVARFAKPPGEPTIDVVDRAAAAMADAEPQAVIAIGGGSVIDTAKAARLCAELGLTLAPFLESARAFSNPDVPLIALPTTAGTGSEVSGGAVITDPAAARKSGIASPTLRPQHALVDPLLTHSMPPAMTAYTGVDALAQAIAGMVARVRTPIGDAIALEAIRLAGRSLVAAYADGGNAEARSEMACASLMAGLTMNVSDCTAEHSLGQAIGGLFDAPHGLTIGLVLAETLEREREHVPWQLERVAYALGAPEDGSRDGSRAIRAVRELLARLEFPVLRSLGVERGDVDTLTSLALEDFFHTQSPRPWSAEEVRSAFEAALATTERPDPGAARPVSDR
ncbi:MAG: iron-containing alcohol dehydrogenase [Actinomycetota bacterium]|nr:iron-containing alcohol dehydrogenase [Actinomycetota bacterium]